MRSTSSKPRSMWRGPLRSNASVAAVRPITMDDDGAETRRNRPPHFEIAQPDHFDRLCRGRSLAQQSGLLQARHEADGVSVVDREHRVHARKSSNFLCTLNVRSDNSQPFRLLRLLQNFLSSEWRSSNTRPTGSKPCGVPVGLESHYASAFRFQK